MQKFHPDTTISIAIRSSKGQPEKHSFGIEMCGRKGDTQIEFTGNKINCSRVEVELSTVLLALEQAERLRCKKVELRVDPDFRVSMLEKEHGIQAKESVKSIHTQVHAAFKKFRFKVVKQVSRAELEKAMQLADKSLGGGRV